MKTLQNKMENWFTAVAYADAGQPGWTDDLWTITEKKQSPAPQAREKEGSAP